MLRFGPASPGGALEDFFVGQPSKDKFPVLGDVLMLSPLIPLSEHECNREKVALQRQPSNRAGDTEHGNERPPV